MGTQDSFLCRLRTCNCSSSFRAASFLALISSHCFLCFSSCLSCSAFILFFSESSNCNWNNIDIYFVHPLESYFNHEIRLHNVNFPQRTFNLLTCRIFSLSWSGEIIWLIRRLCLKSCCLVFISDFCIRGRRFFSMPCLVSISSSFLAFTLLICSSSYEYVPKSNMYENIDGYRIYQSQ